MNSRFQKLFVAFFVTIFCSLPTFLTTKSKAATPLATNRQEPIYVMGPCRIRIANLFGGQFEVSDPVSYPRHGSYYLPDTGSQASPMLRGLGFDCFDASTENSAETLLGIRKDNGHWLQKDRYENWIPFEASQHAKIFPLKGFNWSGIGILVDDTTGDESQRVQTFKFCLVHAAEAICGETPVARLSAPHRNEFTKIEAILRTIEFVDETPSKNPAASTPDQAK